MARQRRNAPQAGPSRRERGPTAGERVRLRLSEQPALELSEEELRALADEGIDPDEVRRLAREPRDNLEASEHDRDYPRDELESLTFEAEDDH